MRRRFSRNEDGSDFGVFGRRSWGGGHGFGTKRGMERALNRFLANKAMYTGEPFVCESPKNYRDGQINVYGVSRQVAVFDREGAEEAAHAILDYVRGNKKTDLDI